MTSLAHNDLSGQRHMSSDLSLMGRLLEHFERRRVYQTLVAMDDHLLDDLGLTRGTMKTKVFGEKKPSIVARIRRSFQRAQQYRATVNELQRLPPAMLADIGIEPGLIHEYARARQGKGAWTNEPMSQSTQQTNNASLGQMLLDLAEATAAPFTMPSADRLNPGHMVRVDGKHLEENGYATANNDARENPKAAA